MQRSLDQVVLVEKAGEAYTLGDFNRAVGALPPQADFHAIYWYCTATFYYQVMIRLECAAGGMHSVEVADAPWQLAPHRDSTAHAPKYTLRGGGSDLPRPLFLGYPVRFLGASPLAAEVMLGITLRGFMDV